jgi:Xaa-Pro aminopeptidase
MTTNNNILKKRVKSLQKALASDSAIAVVSSRNEVIKSNDVSYNFRQDSNFFYLTGCSKSTGLTLIIYPDKTPLLLAQQITPLQIIWEGAPPSREKIADNIGADLQIVPNIFNFLMNEIKDKRRLYYSKVNNTDSYKVAEYTFISDKSNLPKELYCISLLIEPLRLIKSTHEISLIKQAIQITHKSLNAFLENLSTGVSEDSLAKVISATYSMNGACEGFQSIVATGGSSSILHYHLLKLSVKKNDLVLVDTGAEYGLYNSDITRVFPVSGKFTGIWRDIYLIVYEAHKVACATIKDGVSINAVYLAALEILIEGLIYLKVLKGRVSSLIEQKAYYDFFPHGIGHSLGIDVHDSNILNTRNKTILKSGQVLTIEPGLYFRKKFGKISVGGIRLEDDLLVTKSGSVNLSYKIPLAINEVEEWVRSRRK